MMGYLRLPSLRMAMTRTPGRTWQNWAAGMGMRAQVLLGGLVVRNAYLTLP